MNTRSILATPLLCLLGASSTFAEVDLAALEKRVAALEAEVAQLKAEKSAATETVRDESDEEARLRSVAQEVRRRRATRNAAEEERLVGTYENEAGDAIRLLPHGKAEVLFDGTSYNATWRVSNSVVDITGPFGNDNARERLRFYFDSDQNLLSDGSKAARSHSAYVKKSEAAQPDAQPTEPTTTER